MSEYTPLHSFKKHPYREPDPPTSPHPSLLQRLKHKRGVKLVVGMLTIALAVVTLIALLAFPGMLLLYCLKPNHALTEQDMCLVPVISIMTGVGCLLGYKFLHAFYEATGQIGSSVLDHVDLWNNRRK